MFQFPSQPLTAQPAKAAMPTILQALFREAFYARCSNPELLIRSLTPRIFAASHCWFLIQNPAGNRPDLRELQGSSAPSAAH